MRPQYLGSCQVLAGADMQVSRQLPIAQPPDTRGLAQVTRCLFLDVVACLREILL